MSAQREPRRKPAEPQARLDTRAQLLEAAGELFAERGYDAVTGREICLKADANTAAINYHFGGMEGLYAAVLAEARERVVSQDAVAAALGREGPIAERLVEVVRTAVRAALGQTPSSWGLRLIGRELTSPSALGGQLLPATAQPRIAVIRAVIGALTGLPDDHPAISRCCLSLGAPIQILMIADKDILRRLYPDLDLSPDGVDVLVEHLIRFATAGLQAVAEAERRRDEG